MRLKRFFPLIMTMCLIVGSFTACGKTPGNSADVKTTAGAMKIADIKKAYGVTATHEQNELLPFWNVDQNTVFTLHFNSKVEPGLAVTVHTDPKCEANSTVSQLNGAYLCNDGGVDVVVKPGLPVLTGEEGFDTKARWGEAPIYYLKINYDRFSTDVKKLDNPIIVPFTVKANVSTPTMKGRIASNGQYSLEWTPVEGAVKYELYESKTGVDSDNNKMIKGYTRSECGYSGDHLEKIAETTEPHFEDLKYDMVDDSEYYKDDQGHIAIQNRFSPLTYFVRAVDAEGNVSNLSMAVEAWKVAGQLPDNAIDLYELNSLPETVEVTMKDNSKTQMPIDFKKIEDEDGGAKYEYSIRGTALTGAVHVKGDNLPDEKRSSVSVNYGMYEIKSDKSIIPEATAETLTEAQKAIIDPNAANGREMQVYPKDVRMARADIEGVRIIQDGVYNTTPEELLSEYPSFYEMIKLGNDDSGVAPESGDEEQGDSSDAGVEPTEPTQPSEPTEPTQPSEPSEPTEPAEPTEPESGETPDGEELIGDKPVNPEIGDANEAEVPGSDYPFFADTAEEEYMARMMIAGEDEIDVSAFPRLQDTTYLSDVFYKVYIQNPYVISPQRLEYNPENHMVKIGYVYDKDTMHEKQKEISKEVLEIVDDTVDSGMSDDEKVLAIWNKVEDETEYDDEACEEAEKSGFSVSDNGFTDSFNAYGILCNKKGVCQSYAYAYKLLLTEAGVDAKVLTGYLNKTLPHAWSIVNIDGGWYWFDLTNNAKNSGVPYMVYESSSKNAEAQNYVLDDMYDLNSNLGWVESDDNSKNYYVKNDLVVSSMSEVPSKIAAARKLMRYNSYAIYVEGGVKEEDFTEDVMRETGKALVEAGVSESELQNINIGAAGNYILFLEGREVD